MAAMSAPESDALAAELASAKARIESLTVELQQAKEHSVAVQLQAEREEEAITLKLMRKLEQLRREKALLATEVEQEEEFMTNTLQKRLEKVASEKAELELRVIEMKKQTEHLAAEKAKLCKEKVDLEATLESESEFIVNSLQVQLDKLNKEKLNLMREKTDLQRQVGDLGSAVDKLKKDHVKLEQEMEMEEEAIVHKLSRQLEALMRALRLVEEKLAAKGMTMRDLGIQPQDLPASESLRIYSRSPSTSNSLNKDSFGFYGTGGHAGSSPTSSITLGGMLRRDSRHSSNSGVPLLTSVDGPSSGITLRNSSSHLHHALSSNSNPGSAGSHSKPSSGVVEPTPGA